KLVSFFIPLFFCSFSYSQEVKHEHSILHSFIENKGQWDKDVLFQSKFEGGNLWVQQQKFVFHLQDFSALHQIHASTNATVSPTIKQHAVHLNFIGSNKVEKITKSGKTQVYFNYILGNQKES